MREDRFAQNSRPQCHWKLFVPLLTAQRPSARSGAG